MHWRARFVFISSLCFLISCLSVTGVAAQNNGYKLSDLNPRVSDLIVSRPSIGPLGESNFVPGFSLVNAWSNANPIDQSNGWNFFSAMGFEEPIIRRTLVSVLQGPIRYLPVRGVSRPINRTNPSVIEVRYLIPVCLQSNTRCTGSEPIVDAMLAMTSVEGKRPPLWLQFFGANGSRYCWLLDDGWNCKAPPGGWANQPYVLSSNTDVSRLVAEVASGWQRGGPGIRIGEVFGPLGGSSLPQPDPHEVRCMMREIAC